MSVVGTIVISIVFDRHDLIGMVEDALANAEVRVLKKSNVIP
jgi:hypothetical protein